MRDPRDTAKTIRFSKTEADLLEQSAELHGMSVSDVVREAVIFWRDHSGDRSSALSSWVDELIDTHGPSANLVARINDRFSLDVEIDGTEPDHFMAQAVYDRRNQLQIWVGDPRTDARAYLGRLPAVAGASITVPLGSLASLGASDVEAV